MGGGESQPKGIGVADAEPTRHQSASCLMFIWAIQPQPGSENNFVTLCFC